MGRLGALIPLILALVIAVVASVFLYNWVQKKGTGGTESRVVQAETVNVAVAVVDLSWGTKLKPEMIKMVPYLKDSIPPGAFTDPGKLAGRVLIDPTKKGEPMLESRLAPESVEHGGVAAIVGPGKRALAVKGDRVLGMAGLIRPGSHVDVLATISNPGAENDAQKDITKTVLENIRVLATGTELEQDSKGTTTQIDVYTLEVSPEEAEKLALASTKGRLHFALRNATDVNYVTTQGTTIPTMLALENWESYEEPAPKPDAKETIVVATPPPPRPKSRTVTVEVLKGTDLSKVNFSKED